MAPSAVAISLASLLLRFGVGVTFLMAGLEKVVRGPGYTVGYFSSLGIPLPELVGPTIAWFELVAGILVLVGAATTLAGALLTIEMLVALLLVRLPEAARAFSVVDAFVAVRLEVLLALAALALALLGPGQWSIDVVLSKWRRRRNPSDQ
jgi:putative oxidoreductase